MLSWRSISRRASSVLGGAHRWDSNRQFSAGSIYPVLACLSGTQNIGVRQVMDVTGRAGLPPPTRKATETAGKSTKTGNDTLRPQSRHPTSLPPPMSSRRWRIPFAGRISLFRVVSGTLKVGHVIPAMPPTNVDEAPVGSLALLQGKEPGPHRRDPEPATWARSRS